MISRKLPVIILIIVLLPLFTEAQTKITVKNSIDKQSQVTAKLFGNFFEFLFGFINGKYGFWSQELINRGFDMYDYDGHGTSYSWKVYNPQSNPLDAIRLLKGGYNENGLTFQRIYKQSTYGFYGISQSVYVYDTVGGDFYVYLRSESKTTRAYLVLSDTSDSGNILFSAEINGISDKWQKFSIETPGNLGTNTVNLAICLKESGSVDIDEASFMPQNNVNGVRREFYEIFKEWQPGIIRYPGGWFADSKRCYLEFLIGDIDKRQSPNLVNPLEPQRVDFGLDEFMMLCDSVNAEAHLVVNIANATPERSANWVEYCNSDTNTVFGAMRAANGHIKPYNVKYWEIGNEQWVDPLNMSKKYLRHYQRMKEIDPSIKTMIDGDIWGGETYLDTLFSVIDNRTEYYSYHSIYPAMPTVKDYNDTNRYMIVMGISYLPEREVNMLREWKKKWDKNDQVKFSLTELFLDYRTPRDILDSFDINSTLETGLWMAGYLNGALRISKYLDILEKTFGIAHIKAGYNKYGKRVIFPTPFQTVLTFYQNHRGNYLLPVEVECDKYATEPLEGMFLLYDIPYLDATATIKDSTIYLSVLNRYFTDTLETEIVLPKDISDYTAVIYELNSLSIYDANTPDEPDRIKYVKKSIQLNRFYKFPPHSHTIMEFTAKEKGIPVDTINTNPNAEFKIYPNPAGGILYLEIPATCTDNLTAGIYNLSGQLLKSITIPAKTSKIPVKTGNLPKGCYNIRIQKGQTLVFSESFIKL
jgi:alpha-N-arabinofuranosidase